MTNPIIEAGLAAIATMYSKDAAEFSVDQIKTWFRKATQSIESVSEVEISNLDDLTSTILSSGPSILDTEITRKNLARWNVLNWESKSDRHDSNRPGFPTSQRTQKNRPKRAVVFEVGCGGRI